MIRRSRASIDKDTSKYRPERFQKYNNDVCRHAGQLAAPWLTRAAAVQRLVYWREWRMKQLVILPGAHGSAELLDQADSFRRTCCWPCASVGCTQHLINDGRCLKCGWQTKNSTAAPLGAARRQGWPCGHGRCTAKPPHITSSRMAWTQARRVWASNYNAQCCNAAASGLRRCQILSEASRRPRHLSTTTTDGRN